MQIVTTTTVNDSVTIVNRICEVFLSMFRTGRKTPTYLLIQSSIFVLKPRCTCRSCQVVGKLQKVQNAAARPVCKAKKSYHIHPILETLHWLPVTHRIQYKISTICFNFISGTAPQYLSDLLQPYIPARQLRSASDTGTFVIPRVNTKTFDERSFSYAGPSVWNNLPQTLRHSDSTSSVKAALKTHLFNNYF